MSNWISEKGKKSKMKLEKST